MPKFEHDCTSCKFLGTTKIPFRGAGDYDIYVCGDEDKTIFRSIIARYGDSCEEYSASPIFCGDAHFCWLDMVVLMNGFELTKKEEERVARILIERFKSKLTQKDYRDFVIDFDGPGNIFYHPGKI